MLGGGVGRRVRLRAHAVVRQSVSKVGWLRGGSAGARRRLVWAGAGVLALIAIALWMLWPAPPEQPRARQYRDVNACLLTDEHGITAAAAKPVWAGMQDASLATLARVEYVEVRGAQTTDNAQTYLASLVQGRCAVVLSVGAAPVAAVVEMAGSFPKISFVTVGGGTATANVSVVPGASPDDVRKAVRRLVTKAVGPR